MSQNSSGETIATNLRLYEKLQLICLFRDVPFDFKTSMEVTWSKTLTSLKGTVTCKNSHYNVGPSGLRQVICNDQNLWSVSGPVLDCWPYLVMDLDVRIFLHVDLVLKKKSDVLLKGN